MAIIVVFFLRVVRRGARWRWRWRWWWWRWRWRWRWRQRRRRARVALGRDVMAFGSPPPRAHVVAFLQLHGGRPLAALSHEPILPPMADGGRPRAARVAARLRHRRRERSSREEICGVVVSASRWPFIRGGGRGGGGGGGGCGHSQRQQQQRSAAGRHRRRAWSHNAERWWRRREKGAAAAAATTTTTKA